jgi:predicted phage terminase large subunit-like protein
VILTPREVEELERLTNEIEVREVERNFRKFIPLAWPIIEQNRPFVPGWHIDAIADHLMACTEGHITNLLINIPPRHMKSLTVSVLWPTWEWCTKPHIRGLFISYGRSLVTSQSVKARRIIGSPWYQSLWGHKFSFSTDQNVKSHFENNKGGSRMVGTPQSGVTGEGGDRVVVDDPTKLEDADNQNALEMARDFWDNVLASRINDPMTGVRVIIMQRLNDQDLSGHVLRKEGTARFAGDAGWTHLYLPTEYEPDRVCRTFFFRDEYKHEPNPETGTVELKVEKVEKVFEDPRTEDGELLAPNRFGPIQVETIRLRNGPWVFAGQQQQRPQPKGGGLFDNSWWGFYTELPHELHTQADACQTWDCAFKDLTTSSFVVGFVLARFGPNIYVLHRYRRRMQFPETVQAIRMTNQLFPWVGPILIEDKANGIAVIQTLQREVSGIIPRKADGGKESRAAATSYLIAAGNVLLPGKRDENGNLIPAHLWVQELIDEHESFPRGEFKDQVDSLSQGLFWFHERQNVINNFTNVMSGGEEMDPDRLGWIF